MILSNKVAFSSPRAEAGLKNVRAANPAPNDNSQAARHIQYALVLRQTTWAAVATARNNMLCTRP